MRFGPLMSAAMQPLVDQLCECIRSFAQQPGAKPCGAYPLFVRGSVAQTFNCHVGNQLLQVPKGQVATVTRVAFSERYPGTLYGANFMLQIDDALDPSLPRIDHATSAGLEMGQGQSICLAEQSILSVIIQCSWFPYGSADTTFVQTLFPFEIQGFYEYKAVP